MLLGPLRPNAWQALRDRSLLISAESGGARLVYMSRSSRGMGSARWKAWEPFRMQDRGGSALPLQVSAVQACHSTEVQALLALEI